MTYMGVKCDIKQFILENHGDMDEMQTFFKTNKIIDVRYAVDKNKDWETPVGFVLLIYQIENSRPPN